MKLLINDQTQKQLSAIGQQTSGSFIFHGIKSIGKTSATYMIARTLNCLNPGEDTPCAHCRQFEAGNYPDLLLVQPEDKPSIIIEQIRQLVTALSLRLYYAEGTRVVVIDDAHTMTVEAQNALLKLIEEPPAQTLFILVSEQLESLLPTVRSRCRLIYFPKLPNDKIANLLERECLLKPSEAAALAAAADGAPGLALNIARDSTAAESLLEIEQVAAKIPLLGTFDRLQLAARLTSSKADMVKLAQRIQVNLVKQITSHQDLNPVVAASQFEALERFRRAQAAKVTLKAAFERLMLEL